MSFEVSKIGSDGSQSIKQKISKYIIRLFYIFLGIFGIYAIYAGFGNQISSMWQTISKTTTNIGLSAVSKVGNNVKTDEWGNINALIIGVGGESHQGGYMTDSMILAMYNTQHKTLTMLSIPRDLYVQVDTGYYSRINSIVNYNLGKKGKFDEKIHTGIIALKNKISEIVGVDISYYAMVDFGGFEGVIDSLGGIQVNIPTDIYDNTFPEKNWKASAGGGGYEPFRLNSGLQTLDGKTALKYARSRHTTSDFDRSSRQQIIIDATIDKLKSSAAIFNIKELYQELQNTIITNISTQDMLGLAPYINQIDHKLKFGLTSECVENINQMTTGCFLYAPNRSDFGGAAILLPIGATSHKINHYDDISKRVYMISQRPPAYISPPNIYIYNAIDDQYARSVHISNQGLASSLGIEMLRYGLSVTELSSISQTGIDNTLAVIYGTGNYTDTLDIMKFFVDFDTISYDKFITQYSITGKDLSRLEENLTPNSIFVILGNNYLHKVKDQ